MVGAMNAKALTFVVSALVGVAALIIAVMAVGAVPLGADKAHLSNTEYAKRTAAADQLDARIHALADDVPPALPAVPARLNPDGTADAGSALPSVSGPSSLPIPNPQAQQTQGNDGDHMSHDGDREEGEAGDGHQDD